MTDQSQYNQLKLLTDRFMALFSGRADSWGALHGESIREPVTQRSYFLHLIGNASLGVYPILDDGTCRFAAVDIDRDDLELVIQIREKLWNIGLKKVFIERSKSKGYHLWIFFSQPVRARDVRWIISSALEKLTVRYEVFPKQDILKEGEIGNYINLPYFGALRETPERRVIIDSQTFETVPLENFLDAAERSMVSLEEIELILEGLPPVSDRSLIASERLVEIPDIGINTIQVSDRIRKLIVGDFIKGKYESIEITDPATGEIVKYPSRSEADQAIISALLSRGYGDDVVFSVFEKYPTTGKYKEKERRQNQYLIKSIENAKKFIAESREEKESSFQPSANPGTAVPGQRSKNGKGKKLYTYAPSAVLPDGTIIEMVYDPEAQETRFAVFREGEVRYEKSIALDDNTTLMPYSPKNILVKGRVVLFPSRAEEYTSDDELLNEIREFIHSYVDISPLFEKIASHYVLFTWIYDDFEELPYLRVLGDTGSGKSRFIRTVGSLCYKPIFAIGASSVSSLFRIMDLFRGTLVIDEGDFRVSDEKAEIVKILNNGNAQGIPVLRSEIAKGKEYSPKSYDVFGPKIISTRGLFEDRALESRCITEEMGQRKLREDIPLNLTPYHRARALALRNKLLMFRFRNHGKRAIDPGLADRTIEPRLNQVFIPLLSVIEDEKARAELKSIAREYHRQIISDRGMEMEAQVLEMIRKLFGMRDEPTIKEITSHFIEKYGEDYDKKITPKWIGSIIRRKLNIKTEKRRNKYVIPVSEAEKLERLYEKYGVSRDASDSDTE